MPPGSIEKLVAEYVEVAVENRLSANQDLRIRIRAIGNRWIRLDSYIVDPKLRAVAVAELKREGRELGYGCHVSATEEWDGHSDSYSQVATPQMTLELHEPVENIEEFYRSTSYKHRIGPISLDLLFAPARIVSPLALRLMNFQVDRLRLRCPD